jgi:hypothetical protein
MATIREQTERISREYGRVPKPIWRRIREYVDLEANDTRKLRGFGPQHWVYKGYGLFQYDLQIRENG